jgi:hypothetical protein
MAVTITFGTPLPAEAKREGIASFTGLLTLTKRVRIAGWGRDVPVRAVDGIRPL